MTPDLHRLHAHRDALEDAIESLELELAEAPGTPFALGARRRSKRDRRDEDSLAWNEAMNATKALAVWFGHDREGLIGFWRGPEHTPLDRAPIVRLDARGDFELVARSIGDYFVASVDDDLLDDTLSALDAAGLAHAANPDDVWDSIESLPSPNTHRDAVFEEARLRRGTHLGD